MPTIQVNLMIGTGTMEPGAVTKDSVKWLDYNLIDEEIDNSEGKKLFEYTVKTSLKEQLDGNPISLKL